MTIYYARYSANWDNAPGGHTPDTIWNDAADGSGNWGTPGASDTVNLNGFNVTLNLNVTIALITAAGATGTLSSSGTRIVNSPVTYAGSISSGMVTTGTGANLTINGTVTNSSTGSACGPSGSGVLTISNVGGTAVTSSNGRTVYHDSSGALTITGSVSMTGDTQGLEIRGGTNSITGDLTLGNTTYNIYLQSGTTTINGKITCTKGPALRTLGTAILLGNLITTGNGRIADLGSGELTWVGDRTVAAGEMLNLGMQTAGTWKFATATDALTLTNSGKFSFVYAAGTCTLTAAGGTAEIINQTASAGTAILGQAVTVTGPVIPDEEDVLKPADGGPATYGYSGDPQTGTAVAATGVARGSATLAKETGANARGGSGTCAKLSPTSVSLWGYWEFFVKVPAGEFKLSFYYKSFHTTAAWNGTLKVSLWDSDDPDESPPPLLDNVDVAGTYDATYRLWESAAKTAAAEGLCRVRIAILNGSDSGGVYLDDLAVTAT